MLAAAVQSLPETPDPDFNRINLHWTLAAGREIGARSRVVKIGQGTLFVEVIGAEWVPVVRTYERQILGKLNKIFDSKGITAIILKQSCRQPVRLEEHWQVEASAHPGP